MRSALRGYGILILLIAAVAWGACGGGGGSSQVSNTNFEASEEFTIPDVDAGGLSQFFLLGKNGEITVSGSTDDSNFVTITGNKRVRSESLEDAQANLDNLVVDLQEVGTDVFVNTVQPVNTGGRVYVVDYTVTLPSDLKVFVTNLNGNVTIDTIDNDVSVVLLNGDVTLLQINGSATVNKSDTPSALNGTIVAEVTLPFNGEIDFNLNIGSIFLDLPTTTSALFSAAVRDIGTINVTGLNLQEEVITPLSHTGRLGGGDGTITLETGIGDVNVSGF